MAVETHNCDQYAVYVERYSIDYSSVATTGGC
jgi:hypothetical protein